MPWWSLSAHARPSSGLGSTTRSRWTTASESPGERACTPSGGAAAPELSHGRAHIDHWDAATAQGAHAAKAVLHELGLGDDPGSWTATTGFTLMAYGAVVSARGVRGSGATETTTELDGRGLLTDFSTPAGVLTGVAGWNAGPHLPRAASRL